MRNYFLTGLVLVGPVFVTAYLTWSFITWVDGLVKPLIPPELRPETYLPFNIPGTGLMIAFVALTLLGFLTANLVGRKLVEFGESILQPHADRAADLQDHEADFRDGVLAIRIEFPHRGAGGISRARHVVAGVSVAAAERRHCCALAANRACFGVLAVHAEPDDRLFLLSAAQGHHRTRHQGRGGDDAADLGRHDPARQDQQSKFAALAQTARTAQSLTRP